MNELRKNLLSKVVKRYGNEHSQTIDFMNKCNEFPEGPAFDKVLTNFCKIVLSC